MINVKTVVTSFLIFGVHFFGRNVFSKESLINTYISQAEDLQSGGDHTAIFSDLSVNAYRNPSPALSETQLIRHRQGDSIFEKAFSDDETRNDFGLGPVFNHSSCVGCHNRDGRGNLPALAVNDWKSFGPTSLLLKISIESQESKLTSQWGEPVPVPDFGDQLFHLGSWGFRSDLPGVGMARVWFKYEFHEFNYPDGTKVSLRKPIFKITDGVSSRISAEDVKLSPRIGGMMIGLGLLEAIPEEDILKVEKTQKEEAEKLNPSLRENSSKRYLPITGKANWVIDQKKKIGGHLNPVSLGRFGWKASSPSVEQQTLGALRGDLGVTNYLFKEENIHGTSAFEKYKSEFPQKFHDNFKKTEASDEVAADLVFYSQTLAVPSRRGINQEDVLAGMKYFNELKCAQCHQPIQKTGNHSISILKNQKIYPFTDLLLHDMGEGLADHRSDFLANGREWRTPPLWGIGHTKVVNPMAGFLHDGRARTLEEALLWHGGEAEESRDRFSHLNKEERQKLIAFLQSL